MKHIENNLTLRILYTLMATGLLLYLCSYYLPFSSKTLFVVGVFLPGVIWLLKRPASTLEFLKVFGWALLPLGLIQLLNVNTGKEIKVWFYFVGFLACCLVLYRENKLEKVLMAFSLCSMVFLVFSTVDWFLIYQHTGEWVRYSTLLGREVNPIDTAMIIGSGLLYFWLFRIEPVLQKATRKSWAVLGGLLVLSAFILLASTVFQARTLLLAYALFLLIYLFARRMWLLGLIVVLAIIFLGYLTGADHLLLQRGLSFRPQIWSDALDRVTHVCNIWLGCGKDGYRFLDLYTHAHNALVQVLYEDGIVGIVILTLFLGYLFKQGWRNHRNTLLWAIMGMGGQMTHTGWLLVSPTALWVYFWLPMTILIIKISKDNLGNYWAVRNKNIE